jgi:hypothetical protein
MQKKLTLPLKQVLREKVPVGTLFCVDIGLSPLKSATLGLL